MEKDQLMESRSDGGSAKYIKMTTQPVEKLVMKLAGPTVISMLVTSFYNLADTFFVRQLENDSMVAAVGIVLPLMSIIQALGFFCGHGSGNYISRALGSRNFADAETMAATGFFYSVSIGTLLMVSGLVFRNQLAVILGAKTAATTAGTIDYMLYILLATPFMMGAIVLNNQLRMQGNAFFAMIGLTTGAIVNIVLDPIFIYKQGDTLFGGAFSMPFGLGMGVAGASLATGVSQLVSFVLLVIGITRSDNIKIRLSNFSFKTYYIKKIVQGGLPSLARQGLASVATTCLNHAVGIYITGDAAIDAVQAAMTGTSKIMQFLTSALIGFGQGFQPVCGFNYGAKKYDRVIKAYYFCVKVSAVFLAIVAVIGFIFAEPISSAVAGSSKQAAEIASFTFRTQLVVMPLMSWVMLCNMMLQNIGMTFRATIVAMARQGLAFVPAVLLLPLICEKLGEPPLLGIELAQAVADLLSFVIALPLGLTVIKEMRLSMKKE